MSAPNADSGADLTWGYKLVGVDLTTDDHQGGRFRYRLGQWHDAPRPKGRRFTKSTCPSFPGDGLCVARTLSGAQSGGMRLGASTMLLVGYRLDDVLCDSGGKVRVKRLFVHPEPQDPVRLITGPGADLRGADLRYADLRGADLRYANLRGADLRDAYLGDAYRPSWLPDRYTVTANGFVTEAAQIDGSGAES